MLCAVEKLNMARPTKYSSKIPKKVYDFIESKTKVTVIPTIEGLAVNLNLNQDTLHEWKAIYPEFSEAIKKLLSTQAEMLQTHGLSQKYSTPMSIFLLKNNHGFKDRVETDITTGGEKLPSPILNVMPHVHTNDSNKENLQPNEEN